MLYDIINDVVKGRDAGPPRAREYESERVGVTVCASPQCVASGKGTHERIVAVLNHYMYTHMTETI